MTTLNLVKKENGDLLVFIAKTRCVARLHESEISGNHLEGTSEVGLRRFGPRAVFDGIISCSRT
jgi:hypothetical protein